MAVESEMVKIKKSPLKKETKRNNSPGIRLVGGRIYDSVNGKTCHQCRQKTRDFTAVCKNKRNNKPCTIMYCHKCLLNRYGEKAEEVDELGDWSCPKCRGICNCSFCMKKRGLQPTGILINTAKATGFSPVSDMLLKGAEGVNHEKVVADSVATPKEVAPLTEEATLPRGKQKKDNSVEEDLHGNLPNHVDKKAKKVKEVHKSEDDNISSRGVEKKQKKAKRYRSDATNMGTNNGETLKEISGHDDKKESKKSRKLRLVENSSYAILTRRTSPRKLNVSNKVPDRGAILNIGVDSQKIVNNQKEEDLITANDTNGIKSQKADLYAHFPLPLGSELKNVSRIDVCAEDAGNALQFLEFCAVFGKILEVKKGQPEYVLQDLLHGRTGRPGKFSTSVQFYIHLLSILMTEQGEECAILNSSEGKNSWFVVLKKCLCASPSVLKQHGLGSLENAADYEALDASEKLRLLNLLCDEVLVTAKVRNWIDDQNTKHAKKIKEVKDKEKSLKKKIKDDIAKAIVAGHGPLSISEHEAIVSRIKSELAQAQAKMPESKGIFLKGNQTSDAVRIQPLLRGCDGSAYWKLNCFDKSDVLHQYIGQAGTLSLDEKWFTIDDEGKEAIKKHICALKEALNPTSKYHHSISGGEELLVA